MSSSYTSLFRDDNNKYQTLLDGVNPLSFSVAGNIDCSGIRFRDPSGQVLANYAFGEATCNWTAAMIVSTPMRFTRIGRTVLISWDQSAPVTTVQTSTIISNAGVVPAQFRPTSTGGACGYVLMSIGGVLTGAMAEISAGGTITIYRDLGASFGNFTTGQANAFFYQINTLHYQI